MIRLSINLLISKKIFNDVSFIKFNYIKLIINMKVPKDAVYQNSKERSISRVGRNDSSSRKACIYSPEMFRTGFDWRRKLERWTTFQLRYLPT